LGVSLLILHSVPSPKKGYQKLQRDSRRLLRKAGVTAATHDKKLYSWNRGALVFAAIPNQLPLPSKWKALTTSSLGSDLFGKYSRTARERYFSQPIWFNLEKLTKFRPTQFAGQGHRHRTEHTLER